MTGVLKVLTAPGVWEKSGGAGGQGPPGANGVGVPVGGSIDQVLAKNSTTNYDTKWVTLTGEVPAARTITTTAPLTGGGDLSADRTLAVNTFGAAQPGVVPPSGGGAVNYLRADGTWALPPGAGGGISGITVKEGGVSLGTAFTSLLFTAAGFDITAVGTEATIILDLTEYTGGALPLTGGGTGATSAAAALTALGAASAATLTAHTGATTSVHGIADTSILATTTGTQTLTGKTIALGSNTISGTIAQFNTAVTDADLATTAALAAHEADTTAIHGIADTALLSTTAALTAHEADTTAIHGIADTTALATLTGTQTLTNKTIGLGNNTVTGTTVQFNTALSDNDFATLAGLETFTNKAISLLTNTVTGTTGQFNNALTDNDFATLAGSETLTNKALNLASNVLVGTTTQFNVALSDNDFATQAGAETLTNKTLNLLSNTLVGTTAQFNTALSDNDFATLAGTETLTGKTINLTNNTLTGTASQFNIANSDSDFYTTGGTDVSVADGGTGRSTSTTANGVIAAGTTATGAFQTILPGTTGQFLKSAGSTVPGAFANIVTADVTNLDTLISGLTNNKADKTIAVTASSPLTGGGTLAASFSIGINAASTTVIGATRLSTNAEAVAGSPLATIAVTPAAVVAGYLQLTGGTITPGSLNITGATAQLTFGTRSGQHLLLASTTHGLGIQGTGGAGQDTVYFRSPTAFYWYKGGSPHSDIAGNPGVGGVQVLSLVETGVPATSLFKYKTYRIWHEGNQGHTADNSGINADMLDTFHASYFANRAEMESLLGDLLYVGLYDAAAYRTTGTKPDPDWELGPTVYRHGMYWVCSSSGFLDFIDADASGRYDVDVDDQVEVANGDWIIAIDPLFNPANPAHDAGTDLTLADMTFQYIPFSAETFVKNQILAHIAAADPHPQYFKEEYEADGTVVRYAPLVHNHQAEIRQQVINHQIQDPWAVSAWSWDPSGVVTLTVDSRHSILPNSHINIANVDLGFNGKWNVLDSETAPNLISFFYGTTAPPGYTVPVTLGTAGQVYNDPHSQYLDADEAAATYLTEERADTLYADVVHDHDGRYELFGAVALHEAAENPHPLYLTQTEGDVAYAIKGHTHPEILEVHPTDGANSADIWIGDQQPTVANGVAVGDLWIETAPLGLQAPTVKTLTVSNGTTSASVVLSWQQWAASESLTVISLERSENGTTWPPTSPAVVLTTDKTLTTFTDTGRTANTIYYYRIRATNSAGSGAYSSTVSIVTKPADVTGVNATSSGPTNSAVSWTAPAGGTYTYEVYVNSVLATTTSSLSYTASGITENETTTFGIRSKGSTGLFGTTVNDTITSGNAAPVQPASITMSSVDYDSAVATWPASTSSDRKDYEVFLGSTSKGFTTALSYTFTGLAASTLYTFQVRTRDTGLLYSPYRSTTATTAAPPDTTPPTAPTINSFQPAGTYGTMVLNATLNAGTTQYRIDSSINNSTWTVELNWTARGAGAIPARTIGTYAAGTTVYCRVYAADAAGNSTYTNATAYTLISSPTYITASSTNHWRASGTWNAMGTSRPVQGYYSNSGYNATGCWFYGTKPNTTLYYGGRRTITSGKIWLKRMDGGDGVDRDVTLWEHTYTSVPAGAPSLYNGTDIDANLPWNGAAVSITLPATWAADLVSGAPYKGIAVYKSTADGTTNYMTLANLSEDANTGRLEIHHLG